MKRIGYLYEKIYDMDNLILAEANARRHKKRKGRLPYGIRRFDKNSTRNLEELQQQLISGTFEPSVFQSMQVKADHGKIRDISKVPYFPDRILHHAVMNIINPYIEKKMIYDSYACVVGKGTMFGVRRIKEALKDRKGTEWFLKIDIVKFYPTIDQDLTMQMLRKTFKDERLLNLIEKIIRSAPQGLPIGFYTSQPLANFVLSELDHFIKEKLRIKYYFRYCDDMVFMSDSKAILQEAYTIVSEKIEREFNQKLHTNYILARVGEPVPNETLRYRRPSRQTNRLSGLSVHPQQDAAPQVDEAEICPQAQESEKSSTPSGNTRQLQGLVYERGLYQPMENNNRNEKF